MTRLAAFLQCSQIVPSQFPLWTQTLGAMLERDAEVRVICDKCGEWQEVDIAELMLRVGPSYSLVNRRCRCRLTEGCRGWNKFYYLQATFRPLWDEARTRQWLMER